MKKSVIALVFAFISTSAFALQNDPAEFGRCKLMFHAGKPPAIPYQGQAICFDSFAVLYSPATKTPLYSAEKLNAARLNDAKGEERTDNFYEEARLPSSDRSRLSDYKGSGYDRGHMAPAADMPNQNAMSQSFSLANMVPQAPQHNRKVWADIEKSTRKFAMRAKGDVYVITGPVFEKHPKEIGGGVKVPAVIYKLVYDEANNRAWAYWSPNANSTRMAAPISYRELVAKTGIDFLPGVNPAP